MQKQSNLQNMKAASWNYRETISRGKRQKTKPVSRTYQ